MYYFRNMILIAESGSTKTDWRLIDAQNKIMIASIDTAKQTVNTLNTNSNEFAALNRNMIEMMPSFLAIPTTTRS